MLDVDISFYLRDLFRSKLNVSSISLEQGLVELSLKKDSSAEEGEKSVFDQFNKVFNPHHKIKIKEIFLKSILLKTKDQSAFLKRIKISNIR